MTVFHSFDEAWQSFLALESVVPRDESLATLAKGRGQLLAFIAPVLEPDALQYCASIQDATADVPGVSLVPEEDLHVTLKLAGFQVLQKTFDDDILREEVPELDRAASAFFAAVEPFSVRIGAPNAFADAIFLEVDDGGALQRLNASLIEHLPAVHRYPNDSPNFLPHITVATFEEQTDVGALREILAGLRQERTGVSLSIRTIVLARYWLLATGAESDPVKSYYLRGRRP